ncbi:MAG: hypothetical protein FWG64_09365 [Firmicutes bacterium]|nr:hypothetical protein [Bacillota bacterium]
MKILKPIITIIILYIVAQIILASLFPQGEVMQSLINAVLIVSLMLGVVTLLFGGRFSPLVPISKTMGLIIGLVLFTIFVALFTGTGDDIATTFITNIIPFGGIINTIFGDGSLPSQVNFARDTAKFFLQMLLNPIITGLTYEFIYRRKQEIDESTDKYSKYLYSKFMDVVNKSDYYQSGELLEKFNCSKILSEFFGVIYAVYAATFVFNGLIMLLQENFGVGDFVLSLIIFVIIIGLILLAWRSPILRMDLQPRIIGLFLPQGKLLLINLIFNIVKMIFINIGLVLIVRWLAGS